jgi:uncharacterized phage infection (PIP) family protein YhgE
MRTWLRRYLGLDTLEETMATWTDVLNQLVAQTTAASAAQATSFSNLQAAINRQGTEIAELRDLLANGGEVTGEMQAKVDAIAQSLIDMRTAADTADNGFEPAPDDEDPTGPVEDDTTEPVQDEDGDVLPDTRRR